RASVCLIVSFIFLLVGSFLFPSYRRFGLCAVFLLIRPSKTVLHLHIPTRVIECLDFEICPALLVPPLLRKHTPHFYGFRKFWLIIQPPIPKVIGETAPHSVNRALNFGIR